MTQIAATFEKRLETLDLGLFSHIPSMSNDGDRGSWLAVQRAVRKSGSYAYLEIGSYVGGSLQQYVVDPKCVKIYSIDRRPEGQNDDRGIAIRYDSQNNFGTMAGYLKSFASDEAAKVACFEADARDVPRSAIDVPPRSCFIDGEHTRAAALADFEFCLAVCDSDAAICFHDDWVVADGISDALALLVKRGIPHTAAKLGGGTFAIFLRGCPAAADSLVRSRSRNARWALWRMRLFGRIARSLRWWMPTAPRAALRAVYRRLVE